MWSRAKWNVLFVVLCFLSLMCFAGDKALAGESGLYFRGGAGPIFFNPPDRDSYPYHEFDNVFPGIPGSIGGRVQSPVDFDPEDTTAAGEAALGYRFDPSRIPICWGQQLRVELSSNFYFPDDSDTTTPPLPKGTAGGFLGGVFYSDSGVEGVAILGADAFIFLPNEQRVLVQGVPIIRFTADYDYVDFNLGARTDYSLFKDQLWISPYMGLIFAILDQKFTTSAKTASDVVPFAPGGEYSYKVTEELDTYYLGATFGLDLVMKITKGLTFALGGSISPLWANTDMDLKFRGDMLNPVTNTSRSATTRVDDSEDEFTFRATFKAELAYRIWWLKLALLAQAQYWDYVPVVEYPRYGTGDWSAATPASYPSDVPKLDDGNMTNWIVMFKGTIYLPWP